MAEAGPVTPVAVDGDETTVQQGISAFGDRLTSWLLSLKGETNMYPFFSHIFYKSLCCWLWWATFCSKKIHLFSINWFYIYSALRGLFCSGA